MADEVKAPVTDAEIQAQVEKDLEKQGLTDDGKSTNKETPDKKESASEEKGDEGTSEDAQKALDLFNALKDPNQARIIVKAMAEGMGLKIADIETKEEKKEAVKSIKDTVIEEMGEDYKFLADKLGTVFEKILNKEIESRTSDIRKELADAKANKEKEAISNAMDSVFDSFENVTDKIKDTVYNLVDEVQPKPGTDPKKYFERLIKIAADENKVTLVKKTDKSNNREDRRDRNRNDAQNRLRSKDVADEKFSDAASKDLDLAAAIRKGMEEAEKQLAR